MSTSCDLVAQQMGTGVAAALTAVDCVASRVSEEAFSRIFGPDGQFGTALTVLLVLYVAFFGFSLMLGRSNLQVRTVIPKMITVGLVVGFATSFAAFQAIFYSLFVYSPDWLATILTNSDGSATATFATKLDVVFVAIQQVGGGGNQEISAFSPPGMMWLGAMLLLLGTVGLLVTARIGLAVLLALGPIFVVLALFNGTRGLFVGWLKALTLLALTPVFAVLGGSLMLELSVPIIAALQEVPGVINAQAAMAFFLVGAVHAALMVMVFKTASTMVAGWQVFGLAKPEVEAQPEPRDVYRPSPYMSTQQAAQPAAQTSTAARQINVSSSLASAAANDAGATSGGRTRETRVYATSSGNGQVAPLNPATSRTHGIGNRFRSASATALKKKPEMFK